MPPNPPVLHHLRWVEQAAAAAPSGRGMVSDGTVPVSTQFTTEHRAGRAGDVQILGQLWRRGH
jgi:hypothetical protein